ncbi:MAG: hypothetical protein ACP5G1_03915, partial [Nanopusillaceae archaeon]
DILNLIKRPLYHIVRASVLSSIFYVIIHYLLPMVPPMYAGLVSIFFSNTISILSFREAYKACIRII